VTVENASRENAIHENARHDKAGKANARHENNASKAVMGSQMYKFGSFTEQSKIYLVIYCAAVLNDVHISHRTFPLNLQQ